MSDTAEAIRSTRTALIIPAHNEEDVIETMLSRLPAGLFDTVIVGVNGSRDRTAERARNAGAIVIEDPRKGYGVACLRAMEVLPPETGAVVFMQADASEDPADARRLLDPLRSGAADLVIGSRTLDAGSHLLSHQRFGNWLATRLIQVLFGHRYTDLGPYRAITVEALRALGMRDENYGWTVEMQVRALRRRLRVVEIPVRSGRRVAGTEKVSGNAWASLRAGVKIIWTVLRLAVAAR
ncbi:MAG: glycosyltransferase family 2 protein [Acidobacteria bacterium]|nr:glycosyltransferase family 2 protein [Acidobacteriota bacterium]